MKNIPHLTSPVLIPATTPFKNALTTPPPSAVPSLGVLLKGGVAGGLFCWSAWKFCLCCEIPTMMEARASN
eukprot:1321035-Amorphochlora_amoeboformis.AAC.1